MKDPVFSICIPVYNRPELVKRSLDSCLRQTYQNIEIVAVDDASTDNTFEVLQSYARRDGRVKVFRNERNLGMVPNWARSFELATGDYVQHLGSDDMLSANFIARKAEIFEKYPDAAFVNSAIRTYLEKDGGDLAALNETKLPEGKYESGYVFDSFYKKPSMISTACTARRKDMLENFVLAIPNSWGYEEAYAKRGKIMDNFVYLKILSKYKFMYYVNDTFYESVEHASNDTKSFFGLTRGNISDHIKFVHMDVVGFGYFYKQYAPRHLSKFRIFFGANMLAGVFLDLILGRAMGSPWAAIRNFFKEYSAMETAVSILESPLHILRRMYERILRKLNILPAIRFQKGADFVTIK